MAKRGMLRVADSPGIWLEPYSGVEVRHHRLVGWATGASLERFQKLLKDNIDVAIARKLGNITIVTKD